MSIINVVSNYRKRYYVLSQDIWPSEAIIPNIIPPANTSFIKATAEFSSSRFAAYRRRWTFSSARSAR